MIGPEPTYEYVKGQGWVPETNTRTGYRVYEGKTYKVTVRKPKMGDRVKRGVYSRNGEWPDIEEIPWWCVWEGIPAGFGGGCNRKHDKYSETNGLYEVFTELVE